MPRSAPSKKKIKRALRDLMDAQADSILVDHQDGGVNVDIVPSRRNAPTWEAMSLEEAEERMDRAIRKAWLLLTGEKITGDPVEFLNS